MKYLAIILLTFFTTSASYADYSRDYIDAVAAERAESGDTAISYRVFNQAEDHPKLLLIMGLGGAGYAWGDAFVNALESKGIEVIVIDNRDTGESDFFSAWGQPTLWWQLLKYKLGLSVDAPYSLAEMAQDSIAVLDTAGYQRVHVAGASMGGMIAQVLAARFPERVVSLTSIMSTTFAPHLPPPTANAEGNLRDLAEGDAETSREQRMRDRGFYPESMERHLMAIFKSGDRTEEVGTITSPTLVIHGSEDPLVPPEHGIHTAEQVEGARFVLVEGMGHNLPEALHPQIIGLISGHIDAAEQGETLNH
ncbi:alpha/beta fold hydrolase [Luminiphilus sp.]|nr:alpha/beta fold hydrolase [Halieaceae bacterium]MBT5134891.1 alpha/beta fold hydrolase [Halieaceae bacterium]MDC6459534.1 alpha/beta fold hydrolase [Luminiphilus sp.]